MSIECPACQATIRSDDLFCMFCGEAVADEPHRLSTQADRYEKMQRWTQAVDARVKLADRLTEPAARGEQYHQAAVIQQEHLGDSAAAARLFDRALDADPGRLRAFESLDQLLVEQGELAEQARSYQRMIRRAIDSGAEDRVVVALARNLAELARAHLDQPQTALEAITLILERRPDDLAAHGVAAELYDGLGDVTRAAEHHRRVLAQNPRHVESYQALRRLFLNSERYDAGWCVCRVLSVLGQANADELSFYERYATTTPTRAERPLQAIHWALIDHPLKSPLLDELFARTTDALVTLVARPPKSYGIKRRRDAVDLAEMSRFTNVMGYLFEFLPVPPSELFRSPDVASMRPVLLDPPALLINPEIMEEDLYLLAFIGARQLTRMRPSHLLASVRDRTDERRAWLAWIIATLRATFDPTARNVDHDAEARAALERNLPPREVTGLRELVARMNADPSRHFDVDRWLRAVDLTADRAGLIFANDLEKALAIIRAEPADSAAVSVGERATELIRYAYSEEYFQVRRLIGHNID
ncbi:MAG: hypothetical protein H6705_00095 [Myxococcales bacterium]|nr:hypothetical protein [Myxococcales bacterium]